MILNFSIKNYRSFRELNTLSLDTVGQNEADYLNLAVIFGPNASGKSNIIKALEYVRFAMQNFDAVNKFTLTHPLLQPFLLNKLDPKQPIFFELTLVDQLTKTRYKYGFEVNANSIVSEWLIETANRGKKVTSRELFTRTEKEGVQFDASVPKEITQLRNNIPNTILTLPYLANNNYSVARTVTDLVVARLVLFDSANVEQIRDITTKRYLEDKDLKSEALDFIKSLDIGIQSLEAERIPLSDEEIGVDPILKQFSFNPEVRKEVVRTQVRTTHNVYDDKGHIVGSTEFDFQNNESLGTQKLMPFVIMLLDAMNQGLTVVIDEFGSSFHPFVTAALIKLFSSKKHNAQLILMTHEVYLLGKNINLKREEVWFVDKNRREESNIISLAEYKPRDDARYDKQYLAGRFGAVPVIFDIEE